MPKSAGRDLVLSVYNGTSYVPVAGLRTRSLTLDDTEVDVTTADSTGRWKELLTGAGVRSLSVEAAGLWDRDAGGKLALAQFTAGTLFTGRIAWPAAGLQFDASFQVQNMAFEAPYDGAGGFSMTVNSSGPVTITVT
jgi:TP901-1 family phage major tail protein